MCADNENIAALQRAALHEHGCDSAAALVQLRLHHDGFSRAIGIGLQFHDFCLQSQFFEQGIKAGFLERRNLDVLNFTAHSFHDNFMLKQTLTHLLRICAFLVDLIDSNDHRHIGSLGMLNGFNRLRHQAVISCDDQDYDIRYRGTALTHLRERFVPWGIEEGDDRAILCLHLIRANMLRDSASFASHNICTAQGVQKRCLTMVDMPHHGHDRRTGLHRFGRVYVFIMSDINVGIRHACDVVAKLFHEQFCGILVDGFVDRDGHAHLEQRLHKIAALFRHTVSKLLHRDGFRHDHIACLLDLCLTVASAMRTLFFFARTLQRRKRTRARAIVAFKRTRNS